MSTTKTQPIVQSRTEQIYQEIQPKAGKWAAARVLLNYPSDYDACKADVKNLCYDVCSKLIREGDYESRIKAGQIAQDILLYQMTQLNRFNK